MEAIARKQTQFRTGAAIALICTFRDSDGDNFPLEHARRRFIMPRRMVT